MPITRKTDYASRVVLELAMQPAGKWLTTRQLAERRLVPPQLIRQIVTRLAKAGLVQSRRGAVGGISLARPPREISLFDVLEAMEGPLYLNQCVADPQICPLSERCPVHNVWVEAQAMLEDRLRRATYDLLTQQVCAAPA
ncbi:MAG: Rrf2 family transcriptional regulator [Chloroflexi bacterium]|nr:Rrf2 family transcriptional regulator [Chloroflexota bacterium]